MDSGLADRETGSPPPALPSSTSRATDLNQVTSLSDLASEDGGQRQPSAGASSRLTQC